jgi:hypothetical protein
MTELEALSVLGASGEINQVLQPVEEGTNRREKFEYFL